MSTKLLLLPALLPPTNKVLAYKGHRFSTYTKGLKELLQWLLESNCKDVCMESKGKYWIPVYNVLEKDCSIVLAHPKYVKAIRGKKLIKTYSLQSLSFQRLVLKWRLSLRQNTYALGLGLHLPTTKVQGRKNLSGFPKPTAT